jgi:hypothetical protein
MKSYLKTIVFCASVGAAVNMTSSVQAQNLLADPGFEQGLTAPNPNPTGVAGWANFGGATFLTTPLAHSGSSVLDTPNSGGGYSVPGTYQVFAATTGQQFTLSGWVYTPNTLVANDNDFAIFQLSFFTGAPPNNYAGGTGSGPAVGVNIGDPAGGGGVALPKGVWTYASITATAPATTASVGAYILDINADPNADFYFDDMSLTASAVPEPATWAWAGSSSLLLLSLFRRKNK